MYSDIKKNIERISATLPDGVTLIAVSKYHPTEAIEAAYAVGQRHFGESKAQDLRVKEQQLPRDIRWHFIGHLQSNKIKYIAPYIHLIHSIDSLRLLQEVDRQAAKIPRTIDCLLQIHIAQEETKFGLTPAECLALLDEGSWQHRRHQPNSRRVSRRKRAFRRNSQQILLGERELQHPISRNERRLPHRHSRGQHTHSHRFRHIRAATKGLKKVQLQQQIAHFLIFVQFFSSIYSFNNNLLLPLRRRVKQK